MAGRGNQSFKKRQKEQQVKERRQEKLAKRLQRKRDGQALPDAPAVAEGGESPVSDASLTEGNSSAQ